MLYKGVDLSSGKQKRIWRTEKIVRKRLRILDWMHDFTRGKNCDCLLHREQHRLHKWNLNCGVKLCHWYKYKGNNPERQKVKDRLPVCNMCHGTFQHSLGCPFEENMT